MFSLTNYAGLQIVTPDPSGTAGLAINNNFKALSTGSVSTLWKFGACSVARSVLHRYKMRDGNFSIATDGLARRLLSGL